MTCVILELHKKPVFDCQVSVSRQLINLNFFRNYFTSQSADHTHNVLISSIIFNWLMEIIHSITPLFAALSSHFFISFFEITQNHKLPVYGWAWMRRIFEYFFIFAILCLLWIGHEYMLARYLFYFDATHQPAAFHIEAFYTYVKFDIFQYIFYVEWVRQKVKFLSTK